MATKSDFMAAEEIKAILSGRDKEEQERIIRWVSESIGISAIVTTPRAILTPHVTSPAPVLTPQSAATPGVPVRKDIRTFVSEKKPKSDVQFAAVMAYFYRFEVPQSDRKDTILPNDLQEAGRQARGYGFKDPRQTLNNSVMLGYFDRGGPGEFKLNAVGENLVAMTLPGTAAEPNGAKRSSRSKRKTGTKKSKAK